MRFQSGYAVFKFLLRSSDEALENDECFGHNYSQVIEPHILELSGEPKTSDGSRQPNDNKWLKEGIQWKMMKIEIAGR